MVVLLQYTCVRHLLRNQTTAVGKLLGKHSGRYLRLQPCSKLHIHCQQRYAKNLENRTLCGQNFLANSRGLIGVVFARFESTDHTLQSSTTDHIFQSSTTDHVLQSSRPTTDHTVQSSTTDHTLQGSSIDHTLQGSSIDHTLQGSTTTDYTLQSSTTTDYTLQSNGVHNEQLSTEGTPVVPSVDYIPPPPTPPGAETLSDVAQAVAGEPSFESLGLGGWSPAGIVQNCLEFLHITCDLPWWGCIAIGTVVVRTIIFPLVLVAQRNAAKMSNNMPQLQVLQMKMSDARQMGNHLEAARLSQEMVLFMREKQINPLKNIVVPLAQAPLFISFFLSLRKMANLPVESMKTGGMLWFPDLTVVDPYYILPIITSATLFLTIEIGTDSARLNAANMQIMKYVLRGLPILIFPFTINFPGAILCYWVSTNFVSLLQVGFLKIPAVRKYFNIDPLVKHSPDSLPQKKGFVDGFKESWTNMKITREMQDRERYDEMRFQKAGRGPLIKTFKYDPTKQQTSSGHTSNTAVQAKKRDMSTGK